MQTDQSIPKEQPVHARSGCKENPWAWIHVRIVPAFVVIDRLGFDRQRASTIFGVSMLGQPFFNPLESRITIQDVDFRDHTPTDELVDLCRDLAKVGQERTADHEHQTTTEYLVVLQQVR